MGYICSLIAPKLIPNVAIMNENSPTGANDMAHSTDVRKLVPPAINENTLTMVRRTKTANVTTSIGSQYLTSISGTIIIPTDTKNIAPNKSFIGAVICSMCSDSVVSARIEPMTNAPNAAEKPAIDAAYTIKKHNVNDTIRSVSLFR